MRPAQVFLTYTGRLEVFLPRRIKCRLQLAVRPVRLATATEIQRRNPKMTSPSVFFVSFSRT
eukprot:4743630-Prymnesium_polylepis.1